MFGKKKRFFLKSLREGKKEFIKENLSYLNLSGLKIENVTFIDCDFSHTLLTRSKIRNVEFKGCDLRESGFEISTLVHVKFLQSNLLACCLEESSIDECNFSEAAANDIIFRDSTIRRALFKNSDLSGAVFSYAFFEDSEISHSNLEKSDFTYADIAGLRILDCSLKKSNFKLSFGLPAGIKSFFKIQGAKINDNMKRYLSCIILFTLILTMVYGSKELIQRRHVEKHSDTKHNIRYSSRNSPGTYIIKNVSYEKYKDYVEKNNFSGNLIKNGDFSSGLDWWMSSDNYYKTKGVVNIDIVEFYSEPACVRAVTKSAARIHGNSKNKDFSQQQPYVNYIELIGYKELAFSFWYKLNPVNAYIINIMDGSFNMLSVVDPPCAGEQWNNFSAIIGLPKDRPVGIEVEITFREGESLVDNVEIRGRK